MGDANRAELFDIKEALLIFVASRWVDHHLVLESDSITAIRWVEHPDTAPWKHRKHILHIMNLTGKLKEWHIQHIPRLVNNVADSLAKAGVERQIDTLMINHIDEIS